MLNVELNMERAVETDFEVERDLWSFMDPVLKARGTNRRRMIRASGLATLADPLFSTKEVAKNIGCHEITVFRMIDEGRLRGVIDGGVKGVRASELERWKEVNSTKLKGERE